MRHFRTISEFHEFRGLPKPQHPLISVINVADVTHLRSDEPMSLVFDFYGIAVKRVNNMAVKYGQQPFDFNDGIMSFTAPQQVISLSVANDEEPIKQSGWVIYIHPDFLWNTPLAATIKQYDFWSYSLHEALFLSEREETTIKAIIQNIEREYQSSIDKHSKRIIVSQLEGLLQYAERFYARQFITRDKASHQIITRVETLLTGYFSSDELISKGLPSVHYVAAQLHLSPKYLSSLLKTLTGQGTQQHIHDKLIEKAKELLSTTGLTVSEIAYGLGFEHLQSFSKLFKSKTALSPLEFRQAFN